MMWWAVWCAAVVAASAGAAAAPAPDSLTPLQPLDLVQIDNPAPDDDSLGYAVPPMGGRYASSAGAPWLYFLADVPHDSQVWKKAGQVERSRRGFSVNPPVEVLQRGAYNYYLSQVAHHNRDFLNCVGKRGPRADEAADAVPVHRPAHVGAAPEAQPGERPQGAGTPSCSQQELPQRYRQTRLSALHEGRARSKRKMPSLSINNPMEVLRQRLMLEVARKQMREASQRQAVANRLFLQNVGKRGFLVSRESPHYGN